MTNTTPVRKVKPLFAHIPSKLTAASTTPSLSSLSFSAKMCCQNSLPRLFHVNFHFHLKSIKNCFYMLIVSCLCDAWHVHDAIKGCKSFVATTSLNWMIPNTPVHIHRFPPLAYKRGSLQRGLFKAQAALCRDEPLTLFFQIHFPESSNSL